MINLFEKNNRFFAKKRARWFLQKGEIVISSIGFKSKGDASRYIDSFPLEWRVGFLFKLRGDSSEYKIVNRHGIMPRS